MHSSGLIFGSDPLFVIPFAQNRTQNNAHKVCPSAQDAHALAESDAALILTGIIAGSLLIRCCCTESLKPTTNESFDFFFLAGPLTHVCLFCWVYFLILVVVLSNRWPSRAAIFYCVRPVDFVAAFAGSIVLYIHF